jgi:hypothetical protein
LVSETIHPLGSVAVKFGPTRDLPSNVKPFVGVPRLGTGAVVAAVGDGVVVTTALGGELVVVELWADDWGAVKRPARKVAAKTRASPSPTATMANQGVGEDCIRGAGGAGGVHAGPPLCGGVGA